MCDPDESQRRGLETGLTHRLPEQFLNHKSLLSHKYYDDGRPESGSD